MKSKLPPLDARIPQWDFKDLTVRNCPVCSLPAADAAYQRPDDLYVRLCKTCGTFFVSPSPSEAQLNAFYKNYDDGHRRAPRIDRNDLAASYKRFDPFSDLRIRELSSLVNLKASRVLDIGFGRPEFLYRVKKLGAEPFGLELDTQAIEFARYLGIQVFRENILHFSSDIKFDVVAMLDLVEHPLDPFGMLRKSCELLRPGGWLVIWTPNGDAAHLEKDPTTFRVDLEHMQYFTPDTCLYLASELKLRTVHLETLGYPDLKGIDKPLSKNKKLKPFLKKMIKSLPGFSIANHLRQNVLNKKQDERSGSYHLFCILQKPA